MDTYCKTDPLDNGIEYLVLYYANIGGSSATAVPSLQLVYGSDQIAHVQDSGKGTSNHWDSVQCQGFARVLGNGSDFLKFQFWTETSGDTAYVGAMTIVAIPIVSMEEDVSYRYSGSNDSSIEISNASSSWEELRSYTFYTPDSGDYLVLMGAEAQANDSNGSDYYDRWRLRCFVDSTPLANSGEESWKCDGSWGSYEIVTITNLTAGTHTFKMECASWKPNYENANFRRSKILVIRCDSFNQLFRKTTNY